MFVDGVSQVRELSKQGIKQLFESQVIGLTLQIVELKKVQSSDPSAQINKYL